MLNYLVAQMEERRVAGAKVDGPRLDTEPLVRLMFLKKTLNSFLYFGQAVSLMRCRLPKNLPAENKLDATCSLERRVKFDPLIFPSISLPASW